MPSLMDPNFFRSVVLLCAHTEEAGAFGLVINRTIDIPVSAVCAETDVDWDGGTEALVHDGGPVDKQRGWLLHSDGESYSGSQPVSEGIALTTSHEALEAYGRNVDGRYKLMLGYAGWAPGQLDKEIAMGAWLTAPVTPELVFETPNDTAWAAALASINVSPATLVEPESDQLN